MATLTISLSDAVLGRLKTRAEAAGTTPEAILVGDVEKSNPPKPGELLRPWIGAIDFGVSDAGLNCDRYLGDALVEDLRGTPR